MPDLTPWETLKRTLALDCSPWMQVFEDDVRLPDGRIIEGYLRLETPGYGDDRSCEIRHADRTCPLL